MGRMTRSQVNQVKGPKTEGYRGQLCAEKLELVDEGAELCQKSVWTVGWDWDLRL